MSYLGRSAKLSLKAQEKVSFLATAGQTEKTGLSYTPSFVEVYVNGVLLTVTTDFTATNGSSITFSVALTLNDEVTVVSLKTFTVADHYNKTEADALLAAKLPLAGGTMTGVIAGFESTGIDDNATSTKVTVSNTGIDVTGSVTSDGLVSSGTVTLSAADQRVVTGTSTGRSVISNSSTSTYMSLYGASHASWPNHIDIAAAGNLTVISGNVGIGTNSPDSKLYVLAASGAWGLKVFNAGTGAQNLVQFNLAGGGTNVGSITTNGSSTSYTTSSDYRLKENVTPMSGATAQTKLLKPCNFDWIADGSNVNGFLAHELAEVVPEAATGTKDAMRDEEYEVTPATGDVFTPSIDAYVDADENEVEAVAEVIHSADVEQPETLEEGQQWRETTAKVMGTRSVPDMQGIDQAKIVPLLTATIQELIARIETLEAGV